MPGFEEFTTFPLETAEFGLNVKGPLVTRGHPKQQPHSLTSGCLPCEIVLLLFYRKDVAFRKSVCNIYVNGDGLCFRPVNSAVL